MGPLHAAAEIDLNHVLAEILQQDVEEITSFLTKGKSRLSLPDKTPVLDMLSSGDQVNSALFNENRDNSRVEEVRSITMIKLSKARCKFGENVLALKLWCYHWQLILSPLVTISTAMHCLQPFCTVCCQ